MSGGYGWHCAPCDRVFYGPVVSHAVYHGESAGEAANPSFAYATANGHPLMGPCDTPGCIYASKPGGGPHDGRCSVKVA